MRYVLNYEEGTYAFDSLAQLRYFLSTHVPVNRRKRSEPVDPLCLEQAVRGVLLDSRCSCEQWSQHYNVPDEVVFVMAADLFIFERTGVPTQDTKFFVELAEQIIREEHLTRLNHAEKEAWEHDSDHLSNKQGQDSARESFPDWLASRQMGIDAAPAADFISEREKKS